MPLERLRCGVKLSKPLKLGLWNVRGCADECKVLDIAEELKSRGFHLCVITETRSKSVDVVLPNGTVYLNSGHEVNARPNGGVGFMVTSKDVTVVEFIGYSNRIASIRLEVQGTQIVVIGCYAPTESSEITRQKEEFYKSLSGITNNLKAQNKNVIVLGDFNCRLGRDAQVLGGRVIGNFTDSTSETSENGLRVIDYCRENGLYVANTYIQKADRRRLTWYHPTGVGAVLDLVLAPRNRHCLITDVRASRSADVSSDHVLVTVIARIDLNPAKTKRRAHEKESTERWKLPQGVDDIKKLNQLYTDTLTANLKDTAVEYESIVEWIAKSAKATCAAVKDRVRKSKEWYEESKAEVDDERKLRIKLRQLWLKEPTEARLAEYRSQRNKVRKLIKEAKASFIEKKLEEYAQLLAKNEMRQASATLKSVVSLASNKWVQRHKQRNNIEPRDLAKYYGDLFRSRGSVLAVDENSTANVQKVQEKSGRSEPDFTQGDLETALRKLKDNKAAGPNGIRAELLKLGGEALHAHILHLCNSCWKGEREIPRAWVDADVVNIYKRKGCKKDPNNYRGIFLLDTIGKIYASMVCSRLNVHIEKGISATQHGFRKGMSTEQAVLGIRRLIQMAIDQKSQIYLVFVDLRKAFDSLPRNAIMERLRELKTSWNVLHSIEKLLECPKGRIKGSNESFPMERGVRQGSKEGPTFFNIIFQMILEETYQDSGTLKIEMVHNKTGREWRLGHIEYADDLCIATRSAEDASSIMNALVRTLTKYTMEIAYDKTVWMTVGGDTERETIEIGDQVIRRVREFTYLGSPINDRGTAESAIKHNVTKARRQLVRLRPALRSNMLTLSMKAKLLETFIKPVLLYGLSTIVLRVVDNNPIKAVLNTARRMILGLTSRKELTNEELGMKIPLVNPAAQLQQRRLNLWATVSNQNGLTKEILESHIKGRKNMKSSSTKSWFRQIQADSLEVLGTQGEEWIANPATKPPFKEDHIPNLNGVNRDRPVVCDDQRCNRRFASVKAMRHHWRSDHQLGGVEKVGTDGHPCPITGCYKIYKTQGWLKRHLKECHEETMETTKKPGEQNKDTIDGQKCPFPECEKKLPTWKGIVNHCYREHRWSAITGQYTTRELRENHLSRPGK